MATVQFVRSTGKASSDTDLWMAYCCFHSGDYQRARTVRLGEDEIVM